MAYQFGILKNHGHTSQVGDGGVLGAISTGAITSSGAISGTTGSFSGNVSAADADASGELATLQQMQQAILMGGN